MARKPAPPCDPGKKPDFKPEKPRKIMDGTRRENPDLDQNHGTYFYLFFNRHSSLLFSAGAALLTSTGHGTKNSLPGLGGVRRGWFLCAGLDTVYPLYTTIYKDRPGPPIPPQSRTGSSAYHVWSIDHHFDRQQNDDP